MSIEITAWWGVIMVAMMVPPAFMSCCMGYFPIKVGQRFNRKGLRRTIF